MHQCGVYLKLQEVKMVCLPWAVNVLENMVVTTEDVAWDQKWQVNETRQM